MQVSSRKTRRLLDKYKTFHVVCGLAICIFSGKAYYHVAVGEKELIDHNLAKRLISIYFPLFSGFMFMHVPAGF